MFISILAWFPTLFAFPNLQVNWKTPEAVHITATGSQELLNRCIEGGVEVRYRYLFRYCRKRSGWFDSCRADRMEVHSLRYDAITESYLVALDRFGDASDPERVTFNSQQDALQALTTVDSLPLSFIRGDENSEEDKLYYVGVRVVADCKRELGDVMLDLPYLLTFGLVKTNRYDSGWIAFQL